MTITVQAEAPNARRTTRSKESVNEKTNDVDFEYWPPSGIYLGKYRRLAAQDQKGALSMLC